MFYKGEECRARLLQWSRDSNLNKLIERAQKRFMELRKGTQTEAAREEMNQISKDLGQLYKDQEQYWQQRGKAAWLKDGDKNTSFFHAKATIREQVNKISGLRDANGNWIVDKQQMEKVVDDYFRELFTSSRPSEREIEEDAVQTLSQPFSTQEVIDAITAMSPLKSPDPDGYPALFYQEYWHIIGDSVIACVLNFLNHSSLPNMLNYTYIVLIPKVKNPQRMPEFRPISLCNVLYKIGSKALAIRLKNVLDFIISPTQSAFVPNHLITDNVLVAFEINHFIRSQSRNKNDFMTLKLDVSKAYDRVEWNFLRLLLLRLGLTLRFVELIMLYVSSVSYFYMLNGL